MQSDVTTIAMLSYYLFRIVHHFSVSHALGNFESIHETEDTIMFCQ